MQVWFYQTCAAVVVNECKLQHCSWQKASQIGLHQPTTCFLNWTVRIQGGRGLSKLRKNLKLFFQWNRRNPELGSVRSYSARAGLGKYPKLGGTNGHCQTVRKGQLSKRVEARGNELRKHFPGELRHSRSKSAGTSQACSQFCIWFWQIPCEVSPHSLRRADGSWQQERLQISCKVFCHIAQQRGLDKIQWESSLRANSGWKYAIQGNVARVLENIQNRTN